MILLNTMQASLEIMEQRPNFNNKVLTPMAVLLGREFNVGFQKYGPRLKASRKQILSSLNPQMVASEWSPLLESTTEDIVRSFVESPATFYTDLSKLVCIVHPLAKSGLLISKTCLIRGRIAQLY